MKLFYGSASPFVRKVMVAAIETNLEDRLDLEKLGLLTPTKPNPRVASVNPLAMIPTLVLDDGTPIFDSAVICEYLDSLHNGPKLFPPVGAARWRALTRAALADGLLEAGIAVRTERARPAEHQSPDWVAAQLGKVTRSLDVFARQVEEAASTGGPDGSASLDIGEIALGCALGWLDFRMPEIEWRQTRTALDRWFREMSERRSMRMTRPANPNV